jgi:hypothetical protein
LRGAAAEWLPSADDSGNASTAQPSSATTVQETTAEVINSQTGPRTSNPEPSYAPAGSWFRDDATFSIRYRPAAHADPVLTSWLEMIAAASHGTRQSLALEAFKEWTTPTSAGLCATCHSIEQPAAGRLDINWRGNNRAATPRMFTKFSHGPHLVLPDLTDCTACHAIDAGVARADTYAGWDPSRFASEFLPISKQSCATCHTSKAAGDNCQQCHNYHVELY